MVYNYFNATKEIICGCCGEYQVENASFDDVYLCKRKLSNAVGNLCFMCMFSFQFCSRLMPHISNKLTKGKI